MYACDKDALICDFAETYHVLDIEALPLELRAILASGLREDSRINMKLNGRDFTIREEVIMHIFDVVHWLQWAKTKDGSKNRNMPRSIFDLYYDNKEGNDFVVFESEDEMMKRLYG